MNHFPVYRSFVSTSPSTTTVRTYSSTGIYPTAAFSAASKGDIVVKKPSPLDDASKTRTNLRDRWTLPRVYGATPGRKQRSSSKAIFPISIASTVQVKHPTRSLHPAVCRSSKPLAGTPWSICWTAILPYRVTIYGFLAASEAAVESSDLSESLGSLSGLRQRKRLRSVGSGGEDLHGTR